MFTWEALQRLEDGMSVIDSRQYQESPFGRARLDSSRIGFSHGSERRIEKLRDHPDTSRRRVCVFGWQVGSEMASLSISAQETHRLCKTLRD